ncbi:MAG: DHA2 family efflux MFS transporter permease subunit [Candidatus Tectomicrobia bacterium]|nr:DHA2 family efflux MFS transporter permease subunit [Candidatus Tectomicrobia bacterium]
MQAALSTQTLTEKSYYKWLVTLNLMLGTVTTGISVMSVQLAFPRMMSNFGIDVVTIQWVVTAYMVANMLMMPLVGWLGGILGNRNLYLTSLVTFMVASALCSTAWSIGSLISFRVLQGLSAGLMQPIAMAILFSIFPPDQRGLAMGVFSLGVAFGPSLGPVLGGYLIETLGWRSVFYVNVPIAIVAIAMTTFIMPKTTERRKISVDFLGLFTLFTFLIPLLIALTEGRTEGWDSGYILSLFAISAVSLVAFLLTELNARQPVVDLSLFKYPSFSASCMVVFLYSLAYSGTLFLLYIFLQDGLGFSPIQAGFINLPGALVMAITGIIGGRVSDKVDPRIPIIFGLCLLAFAASRISDFTIWTTLPYIMLVVCYRTFAFSWVNPPLNNAMLRAIPEEKVRMGSGLSGLMMGIGGSFGAAIFASYFTKRQAYYMTLLSHNQQPDSLGTKLAMSTLRGVFENQRVGDTADLIRMKSLAVLRREVAQEATISGYHDCFFIVAMVFLLAILPAMFISNPKKSQESDA